MTDRTYGSKRPIDWLCMTPTRQLIQNLVFNCHEQGKMGRIIGAPGLGKTTALRRYVAEQTFMKPAYLVEASDAHAGSMTRFMNKVCSAMKKGEYGNCGTAYDKVLNDLTRHSILIVDEAQKLTAKNVELMRELHDQVPCSVVLVGNHEIASRFGNIKEAAFAQIESRITFRLVLEGTTQADIVALCDHNGITDQSAIEKLVKVGTGNLGLRMTADLIEQAFAMTGGSTVTGTHVRKASKIMGIEK